MFTPVTFLSNALKRRLCRRAQNPYIERRSAGLCLRGDAIVSECE